MSRDLRVLPASRLGKTAYNDLPYASIIYITGITPNLATSSTKALFIVVVGIVVLMTSDSAFVTAERSSLSSCLNLSPEPASWRGRPPR